MATPVIITPNSKRKLPQESAHTHGFSNKKRRSIKKNLGLELFPNALFGGASTPGSGELYAMLDDSRVKCFLGDSVCLFVGVFSQLTVRRELWTRLTTVYCLLWAETLVCPAVLPGERADD